MSLPTHLGVQKPRLTSGNKCYIKSLRIIEWLGLGGTFKIIQFQHCCCEQGYHPLDQVAQVPQALLRIRSWVVFLEYYLKMRLDSFSSPISSVLLSKVSYSLQERSE